jgi:hypothetical protein
MGVRQLGEWGAILTSALRMDLQMHRANTDGYALWPGDVNVQVGE